MSLSEEYVPMIIVDVHNRLIDLMGIEKAIKLNSDAWKYVKYANENPFEDYLRSISKNLSKEFGVSFNDDIGLIDIKELYKIFINKIEGLERDFESVYSDRNNLVKGLSSYIQVTNVRANKAGLDSPNHVEFVGELVPLLKVLEKSEGEYRFKKEVEDKLLEDVKSEDSLNSYFDNVFSEKFKGIFGGAKKEADAKLEQPSKKEETQNTPQKLQILNETEIDLDRMKRLQRILLNKDMQEFMQKSKYTTYKLHKNLVKYEGGFYYALIAINTGTKNERYLIHPQRTILMSTKEGNPKEYLNRRKECDDAITTYLNSLYQSFIKHNKDTNKKKELSFIFQVLNLAFNRRKKVTPETVKELISQFDK